MSRFNFDNITLSDSADITKISDNFAKIESNAVLKTDKVTTSADGLMSKEDKTKLNGIEAQANKTIVDSALSSSSTNPVQNKIIKAALDNKVNTETGKGLSSNDFTDAEKSKLAGLSTLATTGDYNDLVGAPILNGGTLEINDGSTSIGTLTTENTYSILKLKVNGEVISAFNNSLIRIWGGSGGVPVIALLTSSNMHNFGYSKYVYTYNNGVWTADIEMITSGVVVGSFTMSTTLQTINLGFTPRCVIINSGATSGGSNIFNETEIVTTDKPTYIYHTSGGQDITTLEIYTNGFRVKAASNMSDGSTYGTGYRYIAFK